MRRRLEFLLTTGFLLLSSSTLLGEDDEQNVPDGPWISAVTWLNDEQIAGTQSQGLLLRPAKVVKASASDPSNLEVVGESETSLWSLLAFDNGDILASDYKGGVHIFADGEPVSFDAEARWIRSLAHTPVANEILAGTEDGKLLVLNVDDQKELRRVDVHSAAIFDIAVSHAGDKIATACGDGTIKIFSWPKLETLAEMSRGNESIWSVVFSEDDTQLISGGADRRIQLWDVAEAKSICTISRTKDWITEMVLLPKSNLVLAACMDGKVVVVDHRSMLKVDALDGPGTAIWSIALSPDGTKLAIGTRKNGMAVMEAPDLGPLARQLAAEAAKMKPPAPQ